MRTRRDFLQAAAALSLGSAVQLSAAEPEASALTRDPRRPLFHLVPVANWMNDPNGPIFFEGKYHLFFQYNPRGATWGNMSWNHAVSTDMLHWHNVPVAFTPTPDGPDAAGCFSGSCIAVQQGGRKRVYALYTGVVKDKSNETIRDEGLKESQCLAWSDDPLLRTWKKQAAAVLPNPPAGLQVTGFRDPAVWKQGDTYYMTVGSGIARVGGCVLLYRSPDLHAWEYLHPLVSGSWNGEYTSNPVADGEMWECPDFFALDGGHVLIYSTEGKVFWQSGKLDEQKMIFTPARHGQLDLDAFYAPKTQLDRQGRRILWGWIPERRTDAEMLAAGWSGMMSLPRVLNLRPDGSLRVSALPESVSLRSSRIAGAGNARTLPAATGEFLCSAPAGSAMDVKVTAGAETVMTASYRPENHTLLIDGHPIMLEAQDQPELHAWVDGSVIEVLVSERVGYTKRFYYQTATAPDVVISISGPTTTLTAWSLRPISPDRMTTLA